MILDYCIEWGNYDTLSSTNRVGKVNDIKDGTSCQKECQQNQDCKYFSLNTETKTCYFLNEAKDPTGKPCSLDKCKRGPKYCPSEENGELKT